jgi:hypothetical protein
MKTAILLLTLAGCGAAAGPPPSPPPEPFSTMDTSAWQTYSDPSYGFSVRYPDSLMIPREGRMLPARRPPLLGEVRFLDRQLAASDTAALQPPELAIEVFAPTSGPLRAWLEANGRSGRAADWSVPGAREAVWVRDPSLAAPNEFFYVATDRGVIALVPLGAAGAAMVKTFELSGK